ncbi:hypothetical protein C8R45DRAFT_934098 [Mycena sanguinolenta]|nr:hypothetical protein C8R45DRAFT_934098 [Mycena sanguinolenta]
MAAALLTRAGADPGIRARACIREEELRELRTTVGTACENREMGEEGTQGVDGAEAKAMTTGKRAECEERPLNEIRRARDFRAFACLAKRNQPGIVLARSSIGWYFPCKEFTRLVFPLQGVILTFKGTRHATIAVARNSQDFVLHQSYPLSAIHGLVPSKSDSDMISNFGPDSGAALSQSDDTSSGADREVWSRSGPPFSRVTRQALIESQPQNERATPQVAWNGLPFPTLLLKISGVFHCIAAVDKISRYHQVITVNLSFWVLVSLRAQTTTVKSSIKPKNFPRGVISKPIWSFDAADLLRLGLYLWPQTTTVKFKDCLSRLSPSGLYGVQTILYPIPFSLRTCCCIPTHSSATGLAGSLLNLPSVAAVWMACPECNITQRLREGSWKHVMDRSRAGKLD